MLQNILWNGRPRPSKHKPLGFATLIIYIVKVIEDFDGDKNAQN